MKIKILIINVFLFINSVVFAQSSLRESWSVGAGLSNFMMNGDLKAKKSFINIGGFLYADKMISPSVGFEVKLAYSKLSGQGNDSSYTVYNVPLSNTNFKGNAFEGESNIIYNLSNIFTKIHKNKDRKFNFSALMGVGIHRYNSTLYKTSTNEVIANFGNSPSKNGSTTSFYYTTGINIKYKFNNHIDFEIRQNFNINEDDHLDAAISKKSSQDFYFKTSLGIVYNFNKKEYKSFSWYDKSENTIVENNSLVSSVNDDEADDDQDGVINMYDIEKDTPKNAIVYGNGVAIDSDEDGIIDLYDKCPLEFASTKTGCIKDIDTDNDGVIDSEDECPTLFGKTLNGCPKDKIEIKNTDTDIKPIESKPLTEEEKYKKQIIAEVNKKNTTHGNYQLDNSVNISDVDTSPIYPDCVDKTSQYDRTNCIITSISSYVNKYYNKDVANSINGKVRVLFIVKEDGSTKVSQILGNYSLEAKNELKRVIETLPKIQPGTLKGIPVPVKYSLLFLLK